MYYFEDRISKFLGNVISKYRKHSFKCALTCSPEVLMKTGWPLRILRNMGTSFFKKAG